MEGKTAVGRPRNDETGLVYRQRVALHRKAKKNVQSRDEQRHWNLDPPKERISKNKEYCCCCCCYCYCHCYRLITDEPLFTDKMIKCVHQTGPRKKV